MVRALHPLIDSLRTTDLNRPTSAAVDRIIDAAAAGGVTPAERQLLDSTYDRYERGWSGAARDRWQQRLRAAPQGLRATRAADDGPEAEDLSSRTKTVWMQGLDDEVQAAYVGDMARLGAELGYNILLQVPAWQTLAGASAGLMEATGMPLRDLDGVVDLVPSNAYMSVWGEDNKILTNGAAGPHAVKVLVPPDIDDMAFYKAEQYTADEGYHPYYEGFQGSVDDRGEAALSVDMAEQLGHQHVRTRTYIEGGNLLPGVTSDERPYAMVGRDTIVVSAFHLDGRGAFDARTVQARMDEMRAAGRLTPDHIEEAAVKLLRTKSYSWWVTDRLREEAAQFLAKLELTQEILARDIGLPADRVVTITQPEFHIDMALRPLGPGEVLVQHPSACLELIEEALRDPAIERWEIEELQQMQRHARNEARVLGPVYDKIIGELEDAGLIAIRTPGSFSSDYRLANFMNGVPGTTPRGSTYYLTNASSIGSLQRAFERFVRDLGVDRVEFLGGQWGGRDSYSASELSLQMSGGLDCREVNHGAARASTDDMRTALRPYGIG